MPLRVVREDIYKINTEAIVSIVAPTDGTGSGEVFITQGDNSAAKYIIHATSPLYNNGEEGEEEKLRECFRKSLNLAMDKGISSIAFPLIAAGSYGYPMADGMSIAIDEINEFLRNEEMDVVLAVSGDVATSPIEKIASSLKEYIDKNYVKEMWWAESESVCAPSPAPKSRPFGLSFSNARRAKSSVNDSAICGSVPMLSAPMEAKPNLLSNSKMPEPVDADVMDIEDSPELRERLKHLQDPFGEYLFFLIEDKGLSSIDVQNGAWITKQVFSKIKTNKAGYRPSKRMAMQLCIGAKLNVDESIDILGRAGYAFSDSDIQDVIFKFFIENQCYDIIGISDALEKYGVEPIIKF